MMGTVLPANNAMQGPCGPCKGWALHSIVGWAAIIEGREIAKNLDIDSTFAEKRHRKKKQLVKY